MSNTYCSKCGVKLAESVKYCPSCGQQLNGSYDGVNGDSALSQHKTLPWYKLPRNQMVVLLILLCVFNFSSFTYHGMGMMIGRVLAVVFVGIILANIYFLIKRKKRANNERWASILFTSFGVYLVLLFLSMVAG